MPAYSRNQEIALISPSPEIDVGPFVEGERQRISLSNGSGGLEESV
jgi:hypothetical protein